MKQNTYFKSLQTGRVVFNQKNPSHDDSACRYARSVLDRAARFAAREIENRELFSLANPNDN